MRKMQWHGDNFNELAEFMEGEGYYWSTANDNFILIVRTRTGDMKVHAEDWIVRPDNERRYHARHNHVSKR